MGLDGFLKKLPIPEPSEKALNFIKALEDSKYILFIVKIIEISVGFAWVSGFYSGLAWIVFTPIWLNIILYHLILNKREIILPSFLILAHLFIGYKNREYLYNSLLQLN